MMTTSSMRMGSETASHGIVPKVGFAQEVLPAHGDTLTLEYHYKYLKSVDL